MSAQSVGMLPPKAGGMTPVQPATVFTAPNSVLPHWLPATAQMIFFGHSRTGFWCGNGFQRAYLPRLRSETAAVAFSSSSFLSSSSVSSAMVR